MPVCHLLKKLKKLFALLAGLGGLLLSRNRYIFNGLASIRTAVLAQAVTQVWLSTFGTLRKPRTNKSVVAPAIAGMSPSVSHAYNHTKSTLAKSLIKGKKKGPWKNFPQRAPKIRDETKWVHCVLRLGDAESLPRLVRDQLLPTLSPFFNAFFGVLFQG